MKKVSLLLTMLLYTSLLWPQQSIPLIGDIAPVFTANSTNGSIIFPDDFGKSWKILFSHPRDFTPVCTSEVLQLARMQQEFDLLNVKIAVMSTDEVSQHELWKSSIENIIQKGINPIKIKFPLIDDSKCEVSRMYGMIHEKSSNVKDVRGVFIIDPENVIQAILFYPMKVGRNLDEIERTIIALQTVSSHFSTPVNWKPGEDLLIPASPYLIEKLKDSLEIEKLYYNVGITMWYKRTKT